ncbi:MAG: hypothetical protein Q8P80_03555 [Candidatus Levybacteria bacterium]|nr:hypothetical protein [Candidatus Levybacteria bacterium]
MKKIIFTLYFIFLLLLTGFSYLFVDPNFFYLKGEYLRFAFNNRSLVTLIYTAFIFLFFIFYFLFVALARKNQLSLKAVKALIGATSVLIFSYPAMLSYDIFNYAATAKVSFFYQENPYLVMPIEFVGDPLLAFTHAANKFALYGPLWIFLTGIPHFLGFGNFLLILLNIKFFIVLFYLATVFLIWKILNNLNSVLLFALNPLIIIETFVSSHNDIAMMFLALLSLFLLFRKKVFLAIIFLILSILIKYATLFLLPVFGYIIWKNIVKKKISQDKIFLLSAFSMFVVFILAPLREEIYPWYAIWFLIFFLLLPSKKFIVWLSIAFSFGLLLRYLPFMYQGSYLGIVQPAKTVLTFIPPVFVSIYFILNILWSKKFYR